MAMEGTLKNRNGKLYVLYTSDEYSEPFRQFIWWRVLETRGTGYSERPEAGDLATSTGGGGWRTRNPSTHRSTGSVSTGTGSTQAETVERVSINPPPAGGKELRWRDGRWEKLMAKGWVPAGEGKATTSKKPSTKHSTAKCHHATKKSRALSKTQSADNIVYEASHDAAMEKAARSQTARTFWYKAPDSFWATAYVKVPGGVRATALHVGRGHYSGETRDGGFWVKKHGEWQLA